MKVLPEITAGEAEAINTTTWHKVSSSNAFEQSPLTVSERIQFRELIRQHPRDIYFNTLATVEYRMGSYQEAILAALKSVELSPQAFPGDYAILAMSYSELGDRENAKDYRKRFHESMQLNEFKNDEDCKSFSSEVEGQDKGVRGQDKGVRTRQRCQESLI